MDWVHSKLLELVKWLRGEISCFTSVQQQTGWLLFEDVFTEQHWASQPITSCYFLSAKPLTHLALWQTAGVFVLFSLKPDLTGSPDVLPVSLSGPTGPDWLQSGRTSPISCSWRGCEPAPVLSLSPSLYYLHKIPSLGVNLTQFSAASPTATLCYWFSATVSDE